MAKGWFAYLHQEPTGLDSFQQNQAREKFVVGFYAALFCQTDVIQPAAAWFMAFVAMGDSEHPCTPHCSYEHRGLF